MKKQILLFLFYLLFNRFLGSEGTTMMTTGGNIVLFAIFLFLGIFLFHLYSFRLKKKKGGFRLVLIVYIPFLFFISLFNYFLRIYALDCFGLYSASIFSCLVLCVGDGQALPAPSSGPSSSSSWTEFDTQVLLEPFSETEMEGTSVGNSSVARATRDGASHHPYQQNLSLESSIKGRITILQNHSSPFLLEIQRGDYWAEIRTALEQAPSQGEYNRLLQFENRDLRIRELKQSCFLFCSNLLSENPALTEKASSNPQEALIDFFDEKRDELDTHLEWSPSERDGKELLFLEHVEQDLRERGPDSLYIKRILGI